MPPKYKKVCPYCGETCEGYCLNNLICNCGAKYYFKYGIWRDRKYKKDNPDVVEVVRCRDCKHYKDEHSNCWLMRVKMMPSDYCSYGERREENEG